MPRKKLSKTAIKKNKNARGPKRILSEEAKSKLIEYAQFGYTNEELGVLANVSASTISLEKKRDDKFRIAINQAKLQLDKEVEDSLIKRCRGMNITKEKAFLSKHGTIEKTEIVEELPPSETAIQFYLRNRQREKYGLTEAEKPVTQVLTVVSMGKGKTDFPV